MPPAYPRGKKNSRNASGATFVLDDSSAPVVIETSEEETQAKKQLPIEPIPIKPPDNFKHTEEPVLPTYSQSKVMSHSPKISPSSIPNPNPSIMSTKQSESSYSTVSGYPFSIPGYSAFQPVSHPSVTQSSSSSISPAISSSNVAKSQPDYVPYSNTLVDSAVSSVPVPVLSSSSSTQGSNISSMETIPTIALTSTFSSAAPITTIASLETMPQVTSALSMPPVSTIATETSSSVPHHKSLDSMRSIPTEQPTQSMLRMSLDHSISSAVSLPTTIQLETSMENTSTSMPTLSTNSSVQRVPLEHSQIPTEMSLQRMPIEHSKPSITTIPPDANLQRTTLENTIRPLPTITLDPSSQRLSVATTSTLPSSQSMQRTVSSMSGMQRIPVEHSVHPNTSLESRVSSSVHIMTSESTQRIPLEHPKTSVPSEGTIPQSMATVPQIMPNMPSELRQLIPTEHPMQLMPNIQSDPSLQRMPLEYYMPSLQMMPSDLIMRRMQLLQYMQSLQTMTSEPSITLMQQLPPYAMAMPQSQPTTTIQTTSIEKSNLTTSVVTSESIIPQKQPVLSTDTMPIQSTAPKQSLLEGQLVSSMSSKSEPSLGQKHVSIVPPTSSMSSQAQTITSIPLESTQQTSAIQSEQSTVSMDITTSKPSMMLPQNMQTQSSNNVDPSKPPLSLVQTMPILSVMVSDQSLTSSARMQIVQPMQPGENIKADKFTPGDLMHGQQMIQAIPVMCTNISEPFMTSITQIPLVQSMPYESAKLCNASLQRPLINETNEAMPSLASTPSVVIVSSNSRQPIQSMNVPQSSLVTTPSENSTQTLSHVHTLMPSDAPLQRMHIIRPLQSNTTRESDKVMLLTQTANLQDPSIFQKPSIPYGHTAKFRTNLAQPLPTMSTISSMPSLVSISQLPTNSSIDSMQRVQLQHMPFMSIVPPESNAVVSKELSAPLSLVQSMSSMSLTPSITSVQSSSSKNSLPAVSNSSQVMTSGEMPELHAAPVSTASSLHPQEIHKENETTLQDNSPEILQSKCKTNQDDYFSSETKPLTLETSEKVESSMSSLTTRIQDNTVDIPSQTITKEIKRKPQERFSLKTSIPISKIDMKSVHNPPDITFQNPLVKKLTFNALKVNNNPVVEKQIQRHILIRGAGVESEDYQSMEHPPHGNLTLVSTKETTNLETKEINQAASQFNNVLSPGTVASAKKLGFKSNPSDIPVNDQNNQIVFIQNKNCSKKMILTIQQQNPQILLKRKSIDKNPLKFSSQIKKCKEESVTVTEHIPSKVVALKRLHQGDCDEDDFENLITENQIYGNKIVVKEKIQGTSQQQDLKLKSNKINRAIPSDFKNVVKSPNFVYLSNVKYPTNIMMYKNNLKGNITFNKDGKMTLTENKISEATTTHSNTNDSVAKSLKLHSPSIQNENQGSSANNNSIQTTSNANNKTDIPKLAPKVLITSKIRQPILDKYVDVNDEMADSTVKPKDQNFNKLPQIPIAQKETDSNKIDTNDCELFESNIQPNVLSTETSSSTIQVEEEVSSLDIYEKRKRLRRVKYLMNRGVRDVQKSETKKAPGNIRHIITPEKIKAEIYKEFASTKILIEDEGGDVDSEYEDETKEYESLIKTFGPTTTGDCGKRQFLSNFMLGSPDTCKEILWNKRERIIQKDKIASAYIAAGRLDRLIEDAIPNEIVTTPDPADYATLHGDLDDKGINFQLKQKFLSHLRLKYVKPQYKAGYEITWQEVLKERKRRNAPEQSNHVFKQPRMLPEKMEINTNSELQMLTEIKNCVTENNNLIKKRLDLTCQEEGDSIKTLAEKNFSELDRLSKMADRSVKHFSGLDTRKRDLNPGFDSANIQNAARNARKEIPINFPSINIPSISKIISLKTASEPHTATITQATSMDEPRSSAAGVDEMFSEANIDKCKDVGCQTESSAWPGVEDMIRLYWEYEKARKREVVELNRRNTALKVEGAHITRNAARQSDRARALLAERRNLSLEEAAIKQAIQRLFNAVDVVRNYF